MAKKQPPKKSSNRIVFVLLLVLLTGYFFQLKQPRPVHPMITIKPTPTPRFREVSYSCAQNKSIVAGYPKDHVLLHVSDGRQLDLPLLSSASGSLYANTDETIVFWTETTSASMTEGGQGTYTNCVSLN